MTTVRKKLAPHITHMFIAGWLFIPTLVSTQESGSDLTIVDDPDAHALYDRMTQAMREADSLSWVSEFVNEYGGQKMPGGAYRIWLKKPNYARIEMTRAMDNQLTGVLIGDGDYFWIYWPNGKPRYGWENQEPYRYDYEKYQYTFYDKTYTPVGMHSLGHDIGDLGGGMGMSIIDASTFHGYEDSMQAYLDGVRNMGRETIDKEEFDVIEVSFMKHQRSWYLWLSQQDHLPRKLKQVVRVSQEIVMVENWSNVAVNPRIPIEKFSWTLPPGWKQVHKPQLEKGLLKPGTAAPDFELKAADGSVIKLSNYRGNVVWLNKWRCG
ncbi:MAG: DUF2092 domain-containing protein [Candidatus Omnitrophota bacterium]|nr:MAG: DUF2092 domain-containing protein [Candidatus Omnitrophota bacterium]